MRIGCQGSYLTSKPPSFTLESVNPLEDIRIVSVEQYGAGPFGTLHLADLGADVIKIEDPTTGGDIGRYVPPFATGQSSLFFETYNRNKRSLSLDLRIPEGRQVFEDLVRISDAVFSNLRGDVPAELRLRYADLAHVNPMIVCCSLSGYGMTGPRAADPAYDYIVQGITGWMDLTGEPDGPPTKSGLSLVDFSGGLTATAALIAGVHAARRDGIGMDCDLSLLDTAISMLGYVATWQQTGGLSPSRTRHSAHPSLVPFQNFLAADGWIVVGCAKEKFWRRLTLTIERPELADDPRYSSFATRSKHADELIPLLENIFALRTVDDWMAKLREAGIPCAPVNSVADALADPQVAARGAMTQTSHPDWGEVRAPTSPLRVGVSHQQHRSAPALGGDTDVILRELLGYDDADVTGLRGSGALG